ncbi:MAG: PAS domain S-box protein [Euryarchaeota archaeon]|nr:PAS domain S-box protein [Euryarchaeota archaeon]MDE2043664.1 PAS domain S-box protein [Thermoplasmata archaeon]
MVTSTAVTGSERLQLVERLLAEAPCGVAVVQEPCELVWANERFISVTGRPRTHMPADLRQVERLQGGPVVRALEQALKEGRSVTIPDVLLVSRPSVRYADIHIWPLPGPTNEPRMVVATLYDQTERVADRARARLFYESFLTSSNAIEVTDRSGVLVDVNPAFERVYGYTRAECIGKKPSLVRSRKTPPELYEKMWKDLTDPTIGHWSGEIANRDRRGHDRQVFLTITAIRDELGEITHYLGVAVDLTQQKAWEQGAAHAERLASLGRVAAGVAHEINTPLANILLVAESIRRRTQDPWMISRVAAMSSQVEVAAKIVRSLLEFSRRSEPHFQELDLVRVAKDAVEFLQGKQSADVEVSERYPSGPVAIHGDRGQLIQVLTNILNNAYEAIEGAGRITLEVREDHGSAVVIISDSGKGIAPEALPHIFEPFFTTKEEGKGTGLGLAICHGIVQSHQGTILAENIPQGGAAFTIRIPLRTPPPPGSTLDEPPAIHR